MAFSTTCPVSYSSRAWSNTAVPGGSSGPHERRQMLFVGTSQEPWTNVPAESRPGRVSAWTLRLPWPYRVCSGTKWLTLSNDAVERYEKRVAPARPAFVVISTTPWPARAP